MNAENQRGLSRRDFVKFLAAAGLGTALTACREDSKPSVPEPAVIPEPIEVAALQEEAETAVAGLSSSSKEKEAFSVIVKTGAMRDENRIVGVVESGLVDVLDITLTQPIFVPVDFVNGEHHPWSIVEQSRLQEVIINHHYLMEEIFGSHVLALVPRTLSGGTHSQVNIIRNHSSWDSDHWGFNNQGPHGLAIISPSRLNSEELTRQEGYFVFPHELGHLWNPLPIIKGHPEYDFALVEHVELYTRVLMHRFQGKSLYEYYYHNPGKVAYMDQSFWTSLPDNGSLWTGEKLDYVGLAWLWLYENHPEVLKSIRDNWLNEFSNTPEVPLERFLAWGENKWPKATNEYEKNLWPGGFRDWFLKNPILKLTRN